MKPVLVAILVIALHLALAFAASRTIGSAPESLELAAAEARLR